VKKAFCIALAVIVPLMGQTTVVPPARIGITGTVRLTLKDAIEKVLANDQALVIARIDRGEAVLNLTGAKGVFDPRAGLTAARTRAVTPVGSATSSISRLRVKVPIANSRS